MSAGERAVTVTVPATTANLGPGFDCLGLALELRNRFTFAASGWVDDPEAVNLTVEAHGEGARLLARDRDNLVWRAARAAFARERRYPARLHLRLDCAIPLGKGLGSSASAIVGGVWGAAALCEAGSSTESLLALAVEMEGHPDNVVPAALGGFTVCAGGETPVYQRLTLATGVRAVVAVPSFSLRTAEARRRLPKQVSLADAVFNLSRAAALVAALLREDWAAAGQLMEDRLHQPYRAPLIPGFAGVCQSARAAGAFGAVLSGAGPSVLALVEPGRAAGRIPAEVAGAMEQAFLAAGVTAHSLTLAPATQGVQVAVD
ncbi:MAG: homoserine kinase [Chitinophagales bacterium]